MSFKSLFGFVFTYSHSIEESPEICQYVVWEALMLSRTHPECVMVPQTYHFIHKPGIYKTSLIPGDH